MSRTVRVATTQMDVTPAPRAERLARAGELVERAVDQSARLVVLPEVFNTGYAYKPDNYDVAEPIDGPTVRWMRQTAARLGVHLAGSILLLDPPDVYNALLLVAPDGRMWRYDKRYPWGWERAYFRGGHGPLVAHTDLGAIGLLICWDTGHPGLWRQYAGRVDFIIVSSSPPNVPDPTYLLPDGKRLTGEDMGPFMRSMRDQVPCIFEKMARRQAAWLGVPAILSSGSGRFASTVPNARGSLLAMLPTVPRLLRYLPRAGEIRLECDMVVSCQVVDGGGRVLAKQPQIGEPGIAVAELNLPHERPRPRGPQPRSQASWYTYLASDGVLPALTAPIYRRELRRRMGEHGAPLDPVTRRRFTLAGVGLLAGLGLLALLLTRRSNSA